MENKILNETYLNFKKNLDDINVKLEKKLQELTQCQNIYNEFKFEYDKKIVKSKRIFQVLNLSLKRQIKLDEAELSKLANDVHIKKEDVQRLQDERTKIREMLELKNISTESYVAQGGNITPSDAVKIGFANKLVDRNK